LSYSTATFTSPRFQFFVRAYITSVVDMHEASAAGKELVRRRCAAFTAETFRLVDDQAVLPVDRDLLSRCSTDGACSGVKAHVISPRSLAVQRRVVIGARAESGAGITHWARNAALDAEFS
jgi:hypothetical protein